MNSPACSRGELGEKNLFAVRTCPYQADEDVRLSQGRGLRFFLYIALLCIMLLCTLVFEFISEA